MGLHSWRAEPVEAISRQIGGPMHSTLELSLERPDFATVSSEEMGFAMILFVEAAHEGGLQRPADDDGTEAVCDTLYDTLRAGADVSFQPRGAWLQRAFRALCVFYEDDALQVAICARVMAFHFMMEHSDGTNLETWMKPNPEAPQMVNLHPAMVDAMAEVRLDGTLLLSADRFAERVAVMNRRNEQSAAGKRPF